MALWTPYAQEEPLDLSRNSLTSEEVSPRPSYSSPELLAVHGYFATYPAPQHHHGCYYQPTIPHLSPAMSYVPPAPFVAPASNYAAAMVSPDSTGSWPLSQPKPPSSTEPDLHVSDTESLSGDMEYQMFERDAFQGLAVKNGGSLVGNNPRMRRAVQSSQSNTSYLQQRAKNNLAAKQSRDKRKLREIRLAFQVSFLKKKMAALNARMAAGVCVRCAGRT